MHGGGRWAAATFRPPAAFHERPRPRHLLPGRGPAEGAAPARAGHPGGNPLLRARGLAVGPRPAGGPRAPRRLEPPARGRGARVAAPALRPAHAAGGDPALRRAHRLQRRDDDVRGGGARRGVLPRGPRSGRPRDAADRRRGGGARGPEGGHDALARLPEVRPGHGGLRGRRLRDGVGVRGGVRRRGQPRAAGGGRGCGGARGGAAAPRQRQPPRAAGGRCSRAPRWMRRPWAAAG